MKTHWFLAIVFPLACLLMLPAFATAEGWSLPGWGKSKSSKSGWSWPGSDNSAKSKFASKRNQPSTWDKVSHSTASAWNKTTSALNPWKKETKRTPARPTGARRPGNMPAKAEPKTTWYNPTTWFGGESEEKAKGYEPPRSVNEFLSQPRVPY